MNWSMYTADRTTHLKIVVVALVVGTLISSFGIALRGVDLGTDIAVQSQLTQPTVIKAGGPVDDGRPRGHVYSLTDFRLDPPNLDRALTGAIFLCGIGRLKLQTLHVSLP